MLKVATKISAATCNLRCYFTTVELDLTRHGWVVSDSPSFDFQTPNQKQIVEVKSLHGSARDLRSSMLQLAVVLQAHPEVERAVMIVTGQRITPQRIGEEWTKARQVLRPQLAKRLALVAVSDDAELLDPEDEGTALLAQLARDALPSVEQATQPAVLSPKAFEVWKVLFRAWIEDGGWLQVGELSTRAGCSYPTTAKALELLESRREVERDSSRSVRMKRFPRQTLSEVQVLGDKLRETIRFADATGRPADPESLLRRLKTLRPDRVAIGGVVAARHYDPHFDLHGVPRLDLAMHTTVGIDWVTKLDPALVPVTTGTSVLAVHRVGRPAESLIAARENALPFADPVETLLDLYELELFDQAREMVEALRTETP